MKQYNVIEEFVVNEAKVLVLDNERELIRNNEYNFTMKGNIYPFRLTHNENWIVVDSDVSFKGQQIEM